MLNFKCSPTFQHTLQMPFSFWMSGSVGDPLQRSSREEWVDRQWSDRASRGAGHYPIGSDHAVLENEVQKSQKVGCQGDRWKEQMRKDFQKRMGWKRAQTFIYTGDYQQLFTEEDGQVESLDRKTWHQALLSLYPSIFFFLGHLHFMWMRSSDNQATLALSSTQFPSSVSSNVLSSFCVTAFLTLCSHLDLGLPLGCIPFTFKFKNFFGIFSSFILKTYSVIC
jgi:hypothetical protein